MLVFAPALALGRSASADPAPPCEILVLDDAGNVLDGDTAHAAVGRTPPAPAIDPDPDALRFVVRGPASALPSFVSIQSFARAENHARGAQLDVLGSVRLESVACPAGSAPELACASTPRIRVAMDAVDREHPLVRDRSLVGELDGSLYIDGRGVAPREVAVRAPRGGPTVAATLHVRVLRLAPGGAPAVGSSDEDAIERVRHEIDQANRVWAQCGARFDAPPVAIDVVDPPPPHLVAVGCDNAMPASGGSIAFNVERPHKPGAKAELVGIAVDVAPGTTPAGAARLVARAVRKAGFVAIVSDTEAGLAGTYAPSDVSIRYADGSLATVRAPGSDALSSDPTLDVCVGRVTLDDGLVHFDDASATQGALEERALVRAFDDGDPGTLDVYVVPSFRGANRIGESFIASERGAIQNVVIEDRAGFRADSASFTLGHELGHVLLDDPGHPDDYATDTPSLLMDSDSASSTAFGPRRIPLESCDVMMRESGPGALVPLLFPVASAKQRK
ncbi:MAG: hypothetical protein U0414_39525 [Polyangiaceae bacterium]